MVMGMLCMDQVDGVFWLDAGKDRNNLIQHLQALLNEKLINREPNLNSDWEIARTQLKSRVPSGALLVLDSVSFNGNASNVIEALNIGCKMLIITSDITIIPNEYKTHVIKVDAAFTHDEARELIANKLQISVSSLPKKAHELYKVTKGYPLILSYIIDKLEEDSEIAMKDDGHWDYYMKPLLELKKLSFSKIAPNLGHNFPESIWNKIGYSINKLPTDEKDKFYDLCVFVEDANISPETLVVLWSCCKSKVLELMTVLMKKNLVVRRYNKKLGDYVYGVHSIFVLYLNRLIERGESTSRTVQDLHLKLVSKYREFYRSDFSKIPVNDAYMYNYLGHHLMRAGQYSELPILYSDLKFLEARLRIVGPGNLLAELKMYRTESEYGSHKTGTNSHHCHQHRHRIHIRHVIHNRPQPTRLVSEDDDTFLRFCLDEKQTYCHYLNFCYG
ncbi:hypothetical protein AAG570_009009 [Ranatra chinensis]|uniref:APAF-1 helical domain-containing protein n=1 Tax=Ranatra chinensis TaxID=642074 RepID=A0ABD0YSM1_9HEMI